MDRKNLNALGENFRAFIMPLLNQAEAEDYHLIWEFQKFFHVKRLEIMNAESVGASNWKELLQSR